MCALVALSTPTKPTSLVTTDRCPIRQQIVSGRTALHKRSTFRIPIRTSAANLWPKIIRLCSGGRVESVVGASMPPSDATWER